MKIFKTILINLILFLLLFQVADFYASLHCDGLAWFYRIHKGNKLVSYLTYYHELHSYFFSYDKCSDYCFEALNSNKYEKSDGKQSYESFRPVENKNSNKSVLLFACSYPFGDHLKDNETFSAYLGKQLPDYSVYNRSRCGWVTSHMLYQIDYVNFSNLPSVKLIVYVFIEDHFLRNYNSYISGYVPYYKVDKNKELKIQKYSWKYIRTPLTYELKYQICKNYYKSKNVKEKEFSYDLTKAIIERAKFNIDLEFPDAKFVVLRYENEAGKPYNRIFDELKNNDITVVSLNDLSDKNFITPEYQIIDEHPNSKAWAEITPLFVNYLKDRGYLKD